MGAQAFPPIHCESPMIWLPQVGRISCFAESEKTTIPVEDPSSPTGFRDVTIGSLADIRRLERESEQAERDGVGRRMIWRDFSQNRSNTDVHTIMADPALTPSKTYTNGTPVTFRRGEPVIADHGTIEDAHEAESGG